MTKGGVEKAVPVPIKQWLLLRASRPDLKALLLASEPRTETLAPPRRAVRRRSAPRFD